MGTHLDPQTYQEFSDYADKAQAKQQQEWSNPKEPLDVEKSPDLLKTLLAGEFVVHPTGAVNPVPVYKGMIHDWTGSIFMPNTSMDQVMKVLQDATRAPQIYPEITRSSIISRNGERFKGYWRVERKAATLDVVLDVYSDADYQEINPNYWLCVARSTKIQQVEDAGTPKEKTLPVGSGYGFLWGMANFWVFKGRNNGILAECRSLSLSRTIPGVVAWVIGSFVNEQPRLSLISTLQCTRKAVKYLHSST